MNMHGIGTAAGNEASKSYGDERLMLMGVLRPCLERLDALGADLAAAHLEACLNELGKAFISEANPSEVDD